jgi:hypothetical protein
VHAVRRIDVLHRPERAARKAVRTVLDELRRAAEAIRGDDDADPGAAGPS